ncbi:major facilitator superfamily domain-containing protein [Cunninghamella echinulata]|nr:major facilitator superfamily domain-containing protein [Cunninghamella echinulata]
MSIKNLFSIYLKKPNPNTDNKSPEEENQGSNINGIKNTTNDFTILKVNKVQSTTIVTDDKKVEEAEKSNYLRSCNISPNNNDDQDLLPYSIFSDKKKKWIVFLVAITSFISPLSANIYFPLLKTISKELHTSIDLINLTITVYMIFQGISPSFWGAISDVWGRKPVYILTLTIYMLSCIGLTFTPNFIALLILRMLQAFGSSSTIAVGAGIIGDIAVPSERGGYMGMYSLGIMTGWRWTFGILSIFSGCVLCMLIFFLPETLRSLVGNGSIYVNPTSKRYILSFKQKNKEKTIDQKGVNCVNKDAMIDNDVYSTSSTLQQQQKKEKRYCALPNPLTSLIYFKEKDACVVLLYNAFQYAGFYCVLTSISPLFTKTYQLNEFHIGLCFLANGIGSCFGSFISGKLLNWNFVHIAKKMGLKDHEIKRGKLLPDFPIEQSRMNLLWIYNLLFSVSMCLYGWFIRMKFPLPVVLLLQFILGSCSSATHNSTNTFLIDLFPNNSAAVVASNNIVRCILGGISVSLIGTGISSIGEGWLFTIMAIILFVSRLLITIELKFGVKWRMKRLERMNQQLK